MKSRFLTFSIYLYPSQQKKNHFFLQKSEQQKKKIFFYKNLSNKKKTFFFLQKSEISLQKYQKSIFTHHNKIKTIFFFQKYEIFVQKRTREDEVEQLSSRTGAGEDGRTEGEEKTTGALEQVRLPPLLLLPFLPLVLPLHFSVADRECRKRVWFFILFFLIQNKTASFKAVWDQNGVVLDKSKTTSFWSQIDQNDAFSN